MKTILTGICLVLCAATFTGSLVHATVPEKIPHHGLLTDGSGLILSGSFNLTFKLYTSGSGGAAVWSETQAGVQVTAGKYAVVLGSLNPLTISMQQVYFVGVSVNGGAELAPRVPLTAAPYALSLRLPFAETVNSSSSALSIRNTGSGPAIVVLSRLNVGSSATDGVHEIYSTNDASAAVEMRGQADGGQIRVRTDGGGGIRIGPDPDGSGGELDVHKTIFGQSSFLVDGNDDGTGDPVVRISGASGAVFNMTSGVSDNGAVQFPANSISSDEVLSMPGLASASRNDLYHANSGVYTNVLSRTITCPAPGYVLATAVIGHVGTGSPGTQLFTFSVSDQAGTLGPVRTYAYPEVTGGWGTVMVQGVFVVPAGPKTIYAVVWPGISGGASFDGGQLTLLYVPSLRGVVEPSGAQPVSQEEQ